jgi:hypothetical protein
MKITANNIGKIGACLVAIIMGCVFVFFAYEFAHEDYLKGQVNEHKASFWVPSGAKILIGKEFTEKSGFPRQNTSTNWSMLQVNNMIFRGLVASNDHPVYVGIQGGRIIYTVEIGSVMVWREDHLSLDVGNGIFIGVDYLGGGMVKIISKPGDMMETIIMAVIKSLFKTALVFVVGCVLCFVGCLIFGNLIYSVWMRWREKHLPTETSSS